MKKEKPVESTTSVAENSAVLQKSDKHTPKKQQIS